DEAASSSVRFQDRCLRLTAPPLLGTPFGMQEERQYPMRDARNSRHVVWRRSSDLQTIEWCMLAEGPNEKVLEGLVLGAVADLPLRIEYRVVCHLNWQTSVVDVRQQYGRKETLLALAMMRARGSATDSRCQRLKVALMSTSVLVHPRTPCRSDAWRSPLALRKRSTQHGSCSPTWKSAPRGRPTRVSRIRAIATPV